MALEKAIAKKNTSPGRLYILPGMILFCSLFYYFGELADWAAWESVRQSFFFGVHDIHRLLFLAPIVYAGYVARIRGAVIITLVSFLIFLPRAFFISPYPDPLLRMVLFTIVAGVIGVLVGVIRNEEGKSRRLENSVRSERDSLLGILDEIADGVLIIGPDYRVRFMNGGMVERFGDCVGKPCYEAFFNLEAPCRDDCNLAEDINGGGVGKWQCRLADSREYEVVALPYIDTDGTACRLSIIRKLESEAAVV